MYQPQFKKGIIYATIGSLWWGLLGTVFFKYISSMGALEVTVHRVIWTCAILFFSTVVFKKFRILKKIIKQKKKLFFLFLSSILIFLNWGTWIYAISVNKIIDASYGYFIFPIFNVFLGYIFLKEKLNKKRFISIFIVVLSSIYLLFNFESFPWVGFLVVLFWGFYNLLRKKINVDTDIGLFLESLFILPIAFLIVIFIYKSGHNNFTFAEPLNILLLFLGGVMTVIPLFLFIKGLEKTSMATSGLIFFVTPTSQFLLGFFYYNEPFDSTKLISFIIIWIAVFIYLKDLYENNI
tara:strand:- start:1273 stop:2154 length:882 start_codon:yes stop_codon:yes gene_type:complete